MEACKSGTPCFLCRSLLLSTTVLNDNMYSHFMAMAMCHMPQPHCTHCTSIYQFTGTIKWRLVIKICTNVRN